MYITEQTLIELTACDGQIERFRTTFPNGAELTKANLSLAHEAGLDLDWFGQKTFGAAYSSATDAARAAYKSTTDAAWAACKSALDAAWAAYGSATAAARAAYESATAPALAVYDSAENAAWAAYDSAESAAWAAYQLAVVDILADLAEKGA